MKVVLKLESTRLNEVDNWNGQPEQISKKPSSKIWTIGGGLNSNHYAVFHLNKEEREHNT